MFAPPPYLIMDYKLNETVPNTHFKYFVRIVKMLEFDAARKWMTQTYGLAEQIDKGPLINTHWSFNIRLGGSIIYLRGDEELSWFKVKYGEPV